MKTVWIYVDTNKKAGDVDHLKVFANPDAADEWFRENDPEGVAFRYEVLTAAVELPLESASPGGKRKTVSNGELTAIFWRKMRTCRECPKRSIPIAILPVGRSGWKALTTPKVARDYPLCAKRVGEAVKELQKIYRLAKE
jgi:hypothetical protein